MNGKNLCAVGIANAAKNGKIVIGDVRGGGEHSIAPGTFFVYESSNKS